MTHAIVKHALVVTGTDTGIGKTIFAAGLVGALDGIYWKPVQAGIEGGTDSQAVARLSACPRGASCARHGCCAPPPRRIRPPSLKGSRSMSKS